MNCEECEDVGADVQCLQCGQALCIQCDKKIHNKGNRVLHVREPMASPTSCLSQFDAHSDSTELIPPPKVDAHRLRHQQQQERFNSIQLQQKNNPDNQFTQNQNINQEESRRSYKRLNLLAPSLVLHHSQEYFPLECIFKYSESQGWKFVVEQYLRVRANNGDLMIHIEEFKNYLKNKDILQKINFKDLLSEIEKQGFVHITTRIFGDSEPIKFISLLLEDLSLEPLVWILKAIRKDEMTPTDKLIQSRIKECLGMKLPTSEWNSFFQNLQKLEDPQGFVVQTIRNKRVRIKISRCAFELNHSIKQLENSSLLSQSNSSYLMTLDDGIVWRMSDAPELSSEHKLVWRNFVIFLKNFFDNDVSICTDGTQQDVISEQAISCASQQQNFKWIRSVENGGQSSVQIGLSSSLQMNQTYLSQPTNNKRKLPKSTVKPPKSIQKAIPGGKYGCAQLLKCCGPLELRLCSLGMLSLLIQEALSRGILIYYKTLLIKPNQDVAFDFNNYLTIFDESSSSKTIDPELKITIEKQRQLQDQQSKIHQVRQVVIEILQDQSRGVSLARLPKMIQRRLTFQFDLHELGYTKLKSFLLSIPEISIENDGTTFASGILKHPQPALNSIRNSVTEMSPKDYNKKFSTLKEDSSRTTQGQYFQRNLSNVQDYQHRTDLCLSQILTSHPFGIPSQQLLSNLNSMLQSNFDHTLFGSASFEEYLVKYAEAYADVMVKSRGCVVYPKGMQGWSGWTLQQQQAYYQQTMQKQQQHQYQQQYQPPKPNNKPLTSHHQKSQSSNLSGNYLNNQSSSGIIKADSFIAGMQQHPQDLHSNQSLTFQSVNSNPINKEFFMIQEEESHLELDENLKFIEELLKETDDQQTRQKNKQTSPPQMILSLGAWPWSPTKQHTKASSNQAIIQTQFFQNNSQIASLHSWDFDNQKEDKN